MSREATNFRDAAEIKAAAGAFFVPDLIFSADVAIVLGMSRPLRPLARALTLYRAGLAKRLLFTGGFNPRLGAAEADVMANGALQAGVPAAHILVENEAANTTENLRSSWQLLEAQNKLSPVNSILLVATHFHMRRVLMTAQQLLPRDLQLGTAAYSSLFYSEHNWFLSERGRNDVGSEITKIRKYLDPAWPDPQ